MSLLSHALAAGHRPSPSAPRARGSVLVAGAAGTLGSAVLEQLLATGAFAPVQVLVDTPMRAALRGVVPVTLASIDGHAAAETAVLVFDRRRQANGRENAFVRPQPDDALPLAGRFSDAGVRHLIVVWPHAPALLPEALKHGLASIDEHAIAALPFEHVVFVRSAQSAELAPLRSRRARLARWMLSQLRWMVPTHQQAVGPVKLAGFVAGLAQALPSATPGTRVASPEVVWQGAQSRDPFDSATRWLAGSHRTAI